MDIHNIDQNNKHIKPEQLEVFHSKIKANRKNKKKTLKNSISSPTEFKRMIIKYLFKIL
jgi:hypothetical protein